ncbi:MAG: DNA/RNA nuclease SfsA [Lachnospira sp.]
MKYNRTVKGIFKERPNRFIAHVLIDGKTEIVHVKNTGRCKELLIPGVQVILEKSSNPNRKTLYDLICVYKKNIGWINIDSQAPNKVVNEWLLSKSCDYIKPEYSYGNSRIDFYIEKDGRKILMEVKGCTLEIDNVGYFPDAPTLRGVKHLNELTRAVKEGYECAVAFVIQMEKINEVRPNITTHKEFAQALLRAKEAGVKVLFLGCSVTPDSLRITRETGDVLF